MSGQEASGTYTTREAGSQQDIRDFASTGVDPDLLKLLGSYSTTYTQKGPGGFGSDIEAQRQGVLNDFNAWKTKRDAAVSDHNAYVNALQTLGEGRQATIIAAPGAEPDPTTLVGSPKPYRKGGSTLLGGKNVI